MAYANLVSQACTNKAELICRVRDFICKRNGTYDYSSTGIGWTLHDFYYATDEDNPVTNDWFVIKSNGETGNDHLYFRFKVVANYIQISGFQAWDSIAQAGVTQYNTSSNFYVVDSSTPFLFIYGDLDEVFVINRLSATDYRATSFGKGAPAWEDQSIETATCSTVLSAGTDVSIVLDSVPSYWVPGREVYIRTTHDDNISNVHIEKIELKTVSSGVITADLLNTYIAGSAVSDFVGYYASASSNWYSTTSVLIGEQGLSPSSASWVYNTGFPEASFDPGVYEERWYILDYFLSAAAAGLILKSKHVKKVPTVNGALLVEDILEEADGTCWRVFIFYSSIYVALKEI